MIAADVLSTGPRGRRMLLAYALEAERAARPEYDENSFGSAVFRASYQLDPGRGRTRVVYGAGTEGPQWPEIAPEEVARRLAQVPLPEVTALDLRSALVDAVDTARYWQDPDGEDILVATVPVRQELRRVAEHIAGSPDAQWWGTGVARDDQWLVGWDNGDECGVQASVPPPAADRLRNWHTRVSEAEARAERDRPTDATANWSGEWWSAPLTHMWASSRTLADGNPAGVWFVEDSMGWDRAFARRVTVPPGAAVLEVDDADTWVDLCRRFPLEVTAEKRHDWYRTTGRDGRWVIPDWQRVAEHHAGVHLTVAGYLSAAGTAIDVDTDTASVIAGWAADETFWLTDAVVPDEVPVVWVRDDQVWNREPTMR
ncbi:MAG: hypothetical protein WAX14_16360 [Rhodococcus sp. (in: high G+C Gram-positive bacteria)]|uniref:hypothetical protein n=1 Tax=Rhodococcus sp. TaxID=1831 RepID=UPI003BB592B3